jgi:hypothetical protein
MVYEAGQSDFSWKTMKFRDPPNASTITIDLDLPILGHSLLFQQQNSQRRLTVCRLISIGVKRISVIK